MTKALWETKPLEIWNKAKALRAEWQESINAAADRSKAMLAHGNTGVYDWSVGFDDLTVIEDNPVGAMMAAKNEPFARKCRLASEIRGWGREICGYTQNCWGSQFLGHEMDGRPFPFRDMSIPFPDPCDQHLKRGQQCMDLSPIPRWSADYPMYLGPLDPKRETIFIDHMVSCYVKMINDIEQIFGQEFDDQKVFDNLRVWPEIQKQALRIIQYCSHIPSPLSQKDLYSFFTLGVLTKVDPDVTVDFWKAFADEVEWRVQHDIAAVATERYRWMETHPSPWHFLKYFRYMEQYGAVCVGSQYSHVLAGGLELDENGNFCHCKWTNPPKDKKLRTREDLFRFAFTEARGTRFKDDEYYRKHTITDFAKGIHADGAVLPLWRGGVGCTFTRKEQGLRLSEMGVRVLHYEGSQPGDRTDLDERQFIDALDTWMESQGLLKLER